MTTIIIADTSCLIALEKIRQLHILHLLFAEVTITHEVQEEFGSLLPEWIKIKKVKDLTRQEELCRIVDAGEASAILLALEHPQSILIIDERKGRKLAETLQINIMGTLQVLLLAKKEGIILSLEAVLSELEKNNFRFNQQLKTFMLRKAGELNE